MQDLSFLWKVLVRTVRVEVYGSWTLRIWLNLVTSPGGANGALGKFTQFVNRAIAVETPVQRLPALLGYGWG
jgi:hypothetical protein